MNALYLLRHSLTVANERRLYGGSTDSPLTEAGRAIARSLRESRPLPEAATLSAIDVDLTESDCPVNRRDALQGVRGRALARPCDGFTVSEPNRQSRGKLTALPEAVLYVSSGMKRSDETLELLTGHAPDIVLPQLREMDFGGFEMRSYEELKNVPAFIRWIEDEAGEVACPGGENMNAFRSRVLEGGALLLQRPEAVAIAVCHGGVIVNLMQAWFPEISRNFYEWQPAAGRGYRIRVSKGAAMEFEEI